MSDRQEVLYTLSTISKDWYLNDCKKMKLIFELRHSNVRFERGRRLDV